MRNIRSLFLFLIILVSIGFAEESLKTPNPAEKEKSGEEEITAAELADHGWAKFGVGSWVTIKETVKTDRMDPKESVDTFELCKSDTKEFTILTFSGTGKDKKKTGEQTGLIAKPTAIILGKGQKPPTFLKQDTIKLGDKDLKCKVYVLRIGALGLGPEFTIPVEFYIDETNAIVRQIFKGDETIDYKLSRRGVVVKVADKEVTCDELIFEDKEMKAIKLLSKEIPGGLVKEEAVLKGPIKTVDLKQVVAWEAVEKK